MNPFDPNLQSLAWALLHFLWQGCLVWVLTALAMGLSRRSSAQLRYVLGILGLTLCLALPIGTFLKLRPEAVGRASTQVLIFPAESKYKTYASEAPQIVPAFQGFSSRLETTTRSYLPWVIQVWFFGSLLLALRLGGGWMGLQLMHRKARSAPAPWQQQLQRMSKALGLWRSPRFLLSNQILSPMVVGWVRPLLLMPAGLLSGLDPTAVEALLAHELAHIRRHDYLVNFTQCVVEILLFYHPAVWWISRRVRTERELCCDDVAVAWCADPQLYAETLNRLHELRSRSLTPAIAATGGDFMFRIKRLLIPSAIQSGTPRRFNLAALACSMALLLSAGFTTRLLRAETPNALLQEDWFLAGSNRKDFLFTTDTAATHTGQPSTLLGCVKKDVVGFGTVMRNQPAKAFLGKRVRMSAWVKAENVEKWAGLWLRVDGLNKELAFDNMGKRPIKGTLDWQRYDVVLDVAPEAQSLAFGILLDGPGHVWLDDLRFEIVDTSVAITDTAGGPPSYGVPDLDAKSWFLAGSHPEDYAINMDSLALHEGKPTHLLASTVEACKGFGTLMQGFQGKAYLDKRIRLSAWVKAERVESWAGLWMRVDGEKKVTAFDNMESRPIKGTLDWKHYEVVLDVAPDSMGISLGILLHGKGKVWMTEPTLEIVDPSVPVTHMP